LLSLLPILQLPGFLSFPLIVAVLMQVEIALLLEVAVAEQASRDVAWRNDADTV
jgi:hypothetical protein